jgi:flagellar biosynthesis/type III secretory pathway chaperone
MNTETSQSMTEVIASQIKTLSTLSNLIEQEYAALRERDADTLLRLADDKERQLETLRQLEQSRRSAAAELTAAQQGQLERLLRDCRERNAANGALADAQRQNVRRLLRVLRGDTGSSAYGQDGRQLDQADSRKTIATA